MGTHLTDTEVKNAKLPAGKVEHNVSDLPGLYLRLRQGATGVSKTWRYRYTHLHEKRWLVLGSYPQMTLALAREALREHQKVLAGGTDPKAAREADESMREAEAMLSRLGTRPTTLDDLFAQFIAQYAKPNFKDGGAHNVGTYTNHIAPHVGRVHLKHLTTAAFSNLMHKISRASDSAAYSKDHSRTVGVALELLKRIFSWGYESGHIDTNPVAAVKSKNVSASKGRMGERVLSPGELKQLVPMLEYAEMADKWKHMSWLMLACLTRVGETSLAEVGHIDLQKKLWFIPKENQKLTRKDKPMDHFIELSPFALEQLAPLLADAKQRKADAKRAGKDPAHYGIYLFPSRLVVDGEKPCDEKTCTHQLADRQQAPDAPAGPRAARRTQNSSELWLPGGHWTSHDLRRTGSTLMRNCGVDKDTVERCLNHVAGTRIERTYQKPEVLADMRDGWLALGTRLGEITAEAKADKALDNGYKQKAIQRRAEKYNKQALKMKKTKAKNRTAGAAA